MDGLDMAAEFCRADYKTTENYRLTVVIIATLVRLRIGLGLGLEGC